MTACERCDVCDTEGPTSVVSSGIAPYTYVKCSNCNETGAEAMEIVLTWLTIDNAADIHPEFCMGLVSYSDGQYLHWPDILKIFERRKSRG